MPATFKTHIGGAVVELPATVRTIRESLPEEWHKEFNEAVEDCPANELFALLAKWALKPTTAEEEDRAVFEMLERREREFVEQKRREAEAGEPG
ncbi:hypothetical protein ACWGR4_43480 [Embleya sp. NPDC055664]|uniref:hypothetical protein n=1 Tax=Embleya sp. NPDC059237 TaxID=3346784 RepID=UPI00367B10F7